MRPGTACSSRPSFAPGTAPFGQQSGIWPAFWALGKSIRDPDPAKRVPWPDCGEWDIFENAHGSNWMLPTLHYGLHGQHRGQGGEKYSFAAGEFHIWALKVVRDVADWQSERLEWWLDGNNFYTITGGQIGDADLWGNVAHKAFFPILNVAAGSNVPEGGQPNDATVDGLASGMRVKYVAIYKSK